MACFQAVIRAARARPKSAETEGARRPTALRRTGRRCSHRRAGVREALEPARATTWRITASIASSVDKPEKLSKASVRSFSAVRVASAEGIERGGGKDGGDLESRSWAAAASHSSLRG